MFSNTVTFSGFDAVVAWRPTGEPSFDSVTGIVARDDFEQIVGEALARPALGLDHPVVFGVEIENLDEMLEIWGPDDLQSLLMAMARRLSAFTESRGRLARLGPGQFGIFAFLRAHDEAGIADLLRDEMARPFRVAGCEIAASCAVAYAPCETGDAISPISPGCGAASVRRLIRALRETPPPRDAERWLHGLA